MHSHFNISYYIQKQKVHCTTNCVVRYTLSLTEPSLQEKKALSLHFNSWFLDSEFHVTNICFWAFSAYPRALSMFCFKVLWMFEFFMAVLANYLVCDWQKQYSQKYLFKKMSCAHKCYIDWIVFEWCSLKLRLLFIRSNSCARPLKTSLRFWLSLSFAVKWQVEKRKDMRPTNLSILWITLMGLEYCLPFISVFINRLIFPRISKLFAKVESTRNQNQMFRWQNLNRLEENTVWKIRST